MFDFINHLVVKPIPYILNELTMSFVINYLHLVSSFANFQQKKCLPENAYKEMTMRKGRVRKLYLPKSNFKVHKRGKKLLPNNWTYVIKLARLYWRGGF